MGVRAGLIECPHCRNHLQDTKQEYIDCSFCGKRFKRGTIGKEKEEEMRRTMVMDLSDKIQKMKAIIFAGRIFGFLCILLGVIMLFSKEFDWIGLATKNNKQMEKDQSKMFDLSGGRAVFEY
jgi:uncharacterized membrane protein YvbJ